MLDVKRVKNEKQNWIEKLKTMKKQYITIGMIALLMSCNTSNDIDMKEESKTVQIEETTSNERSSEISLYNGEKWKVNEEMLPHIKKSEAVFTAFEGKDYKQLSEDMMSHTNNLIQSCTMDGASHDELHKWLHPHIELITSLSEKSDQEVEEEVLPAIEKSFNTFHKYFE
tara:strand:+ start:836 stop:1345 length:510 start_codon:yes stop_codon:yes gene_type:complete